MEKWLHHFKKVVLIGAISITGLVCWANTANKVAASENTTKASVVNVKTDKPALFPVHIKVDGEMKYGYIDQTGKIVINPTYMDAQNFSDGVAVVYNGTVYQVINEKGEVIFESEGLIQNFQNGLASYNDPKNDYLCGYINTNGKIVLKSQYRQAGTFQSNNTAIVLTKSGKFCRINKKGNVLKTYSYKMKNNYSNDFEDGYVITNDQKTFLKGVVDLNGKVILKPVYGEITYLGNGRFAVKKATSEYESYLLNNKPAALFDKNGKRLTNYKYYDLSKFNNNFASVTDSKYTYFIGVDGKKVASLPALEGRGTMQLIGKLIQADIDYQISYLKTDGTVIWQNDTTTRLDSNLVVNSIKFKPNKYAVVYYPEVQGMTDLTVQKSINDKLKSIFTDDRKNLKEKDNLSVDDSFTASQIKNLLIIKREGYDYPFGAAHGMPLRDYFFINVKTGDFYQLKDLFKDNSDYVTKLSSIIKKQIAVQSKQEDNMYFIDSFSKIRADQPFYISEDKLTIYFTPYEIAAYAAGFPEFNIPFQDIKDMINTDGAFWKSFHE